MDTWDLPLEIIPEHIRLTYRPALQKLPPKGVPSNQVKLEYVAEYNGMEYYGTAQELAQVLGVKHQSINVSAREGHKIGRKWTITPTGEKVGGVEEDQV